MADKFYKSFEVKKHYVHFSIYKMDMKTYLTDVYFFLTIGYGYINNSLSKGFIFCLYLFNFNCKEFEPLKGINIQIPVKRFNPKNHAR